MPASPSSLLRLLEPAVRPDAHATAGARRTARPDATIPTGAANNANNATTVAGVTPFESLSFDEILGQARRIAPLPATDVSNQQTATDAASQANPADPATTHEQANPLRALANTGAVENASLRAMLHLRDAAAQAANAANNPNTQNTPHTE